jgi:hypothetical protein
LDDLRRGKVYFAGEAMEEEVNVDGDEVGGGVGGGEGNGGVPLIAF